MSYLDEMNARAGINANGDSDRPESMVDRLRGHFITGRAVLDLPEPGWLIRDVIPAGSLALTYGPPKSGKSFVALDQALSVATGRPWAPAWDRGWANGYPTTQGPVIYVAGEGVGGLAKRVRAWLDHHQVDDPGDIHWLTRPVNLTDRGEVETFTTIATDITPRLVVFDTLARCSLGAEENSAKDMGIVVAGLDRIREATGATVNPVHHAGKDITKGLRGSSALLGAADAVFEVTRDGRTVKWRCTDLKDAEAPRAMAFEMVDTAGSIALTATEQAAGTTAPAAVWQVRDALAEVDVGGGVASTVWLRSADVSDATFYRSRKWLVENDHVSNVGTDKRPLYSVTVIAPE